MNGPEPVGAPDDLVPALRRMRAEWRAEQDAAIRDAAEVFRHTRTLADRICDHAMRGDVVRLLGAGTDVCGAVVAVADELVVIEPVPAGGVASRVRGAGAGRIDVVTAGRALVVEVVQPRGAAGSNRPRVAITLRSRLLEREMAGGPVLVGTGIHPAPWCGPLAVGADHVVVGSATVGIGALAWIRAG